MSFFHWNACGYATLWELCFLYKISFKWLPSDAWEREAPKQVVNNLDMEMVEILPPNDR
jgi:hypothetical protein